jgi:hypothetical protein
MIRYGGVLCFFLVDNGKGGGKKRCLFLELN